MRRIDRLWKILTSTSLTLSGKRDLFRVLSARRHKRKALFPIQLPIGQAVADGENCAVDFQVFAQIFLDKVYGKLEFQDRIVIDIGAHKGYFAAYALMSGAKAVLSYEPEEVNFKCLARFAESATFHGLAIQIFQAAVSEVDGEVALYLSPESWSHTILQHRGFSPNTGLRVRSYSLTNILRKTEAEFSGQELILKVDAEGVEGSLLVKTPDEYFASVKEVVFEYHAFGGYDLRTVLERLEYLGFEYVASAKDADLHHVRSSSGASMAPLSGGSTVP
jgi:FkbM family methyltransferase